MHPVHGAPLTTPVLLNFSTIEQCTAIAIAMYRCGSAIFPALFLRVVQTVTVLSLGENIGQSSTLKSFVLAFSDVARFDARATQR